MNPPTKEFLHYDTSFLQKFYHLSYQQKKIIESKDKTKTAPYEIVFDYRNQLIEGWGNCGFIGDFSLSPDLEWIKEKLVEYYNTKGLLYKGNNPCPRIANIIFSKENILLQIENASYFDQVATNLSLDYPLHEIGNNTLNSNTLREWDILQSNTTLGLLPPLGKSKLANTLGVCVGITTYNDKGESIILTRKRTNDVTVSANLEVLPFSFSLNYKHDSIKHHQAIQLTELIKKDFENELFEELGLAANYISFEKIEPLALCRELCRGGKPQLFCKTEINLPFEKINEIIQEKNYNKKEFYPSISYISTKVDTQIYSTLSAELQAFCLLNE